MPIVSRCRRLRNFGFSLTRPFQGNPQGTSPFSRRLPPPQFFESLSYLPVSIHSISLDLPTVAFLRRDVFVNDNAPEFWDAFDRTLGDPKFTQLTRVEVTWSIYSVLEHANESFVDQLYNLLQMGDFAQYTSKLYRRGILWCGDRGSAQRVYPVSGPSCTLAEQDRIAWEDSSRTQVFPRS